ncbi:MAG: SRPBCC family protein [Acidimicrobiia bacterium]
MRTSESVVVPVEPVDVFPHVVDLAAYPRWLPLVHAATPAGEAAWTVELRARVGPFARSKQLRMARVESEPGELVVFERAEVDGREHARWALRCELTAIDAGTCVTMHLAYDGRLWTGGILERVLDEEIRRGRAGLLELVADQG